jgi:hypothetical protein
MRENVILAVKRISRTNGGIGSIIEAKIASIRTTKRTSEYL